MALPKPINTAVINTKGNPCYVLIYTPDKRIVSLKYGEFVANTPGANTIFPAATYADVQAQAASLGLTALPAQKAGEP